MCESRVEPLLHPKSFHVKILLIHLTWIENPYNSQYLRLRAETRAERSANMRIDLDAISGLTEDSGWYLGLLLIVFSNTESNIDTAS